MTRKLLIVVVLVLIVIGTFYTIKDYYENKITKEVTEEEITPEEQEFNESGRAKAIVNETDLWKIYEDAEAGISIRYPNDINFNERGGDNLYSLFVETKDINLLNGTMGFDKATAEENLKLLNNGFYGKKIDWPLVESQKITEIKNINAQEFMVLSRFEVCDITFERKLYFFNNNHQIMITLEGPKKEIIESLPNYFTNDPINCGETKMWNFEKQSEFFTNLENNIGSEVALAWFNNFDKIIKTIELNKITSFNLDLLQGKWVSTEDSKSEIQFSGTKKIDYYDGEKLSESEFIIEEKKYLTVGPAEDDMRYIIINLSKDNLSLTYLSRGNTLNYTKLIPTN